MTFHMVEAQILFASLKKFKCLFCSFYLSCAWLRFNIGFLFLVSFPNSTWLYSVAHLREQEFLGTSFRSTVAAVGGPLSFVRPKEKQMSWQ